MLKRSGGRLLPCDIPLNSLKCNLFVFVCCVDVYISTYLRSHCMFLQISSFLMIHDCSNYISIIM